MKDHDHLMITEPGTIHVIPRPCEVHGADVRKAVFHQFAQRAYPVEPSGVAGRQVSFPCAIVEYPDGQVDEVNAMMIRFTDSGKSAATDDNQPLSAEFFGAFRYLEREESLAYEKYKSDKTGENYGRWQQSVHLAARLPRDLAAVPENSISDSYAEGD